jgi:hypothetical protein
MADKKQDLALLTFTPEFKREFKRLAKKHVSPSRSFTLASEKKIEKFE